LDLRHYNCHDFEAHRYYLPNYASAIIIPRLFETRHYVRPTPSWTHYQAYRREPYFSMVCFALPRDDKDADARLFLFAIVVPVRHCLPQSLTLERQRQSSTVGGASSPLAIAV
jgi:hypothetical protein